MKKIFSIVLLLLSCTLLLFAGPGEAYLRPMSGAAGIPLNPPRGKNNRYTPITPTPGSQGGILTDATYISDLNSTIFGSNFDVGSYSDDEMIAIGGYSDFSSEYASSAKIHVTATCNNGFYMVSQSNPSYKRPFELYLIPKAREGSVLGGLVKKSTYGQYRVLGEGSSEVDITYAEIRGNRTSNKNAVWFDLVLVLDGNYEKGDILDFHGKKYPLTVADDYSAVVNIALQASYIDPVTKTEVIVGTESISIPFTGFYSQKSSNKRQEIVSMFAIPTANAGNINMKNYGRQKVADVKVQATYETLLGDDMAAAFAVFISSHSDPYTSGETFKLVKDDVVFPTKETPTNSVEYDVILTSARGEKVYKGTDWVPNPLTTANMSTIPFAVIPSGSPVQQGHRLTGGRTFNFDGSVSIQIHDNSGVMMEAGRYESSIYIHVVDISNE